MTTILDFQIRSTTPEHYRLDVLLRGQSPLLATAEFDYPLSFMTGFELNRLDFDGKDPVGRFERLQAFGHALYQKLFTPDIQRVWQTHKDRSDFVTLCLRIAPEAGGLEALPWEALFDGAEFLAAGVKTSLSRLPLDVPPQDELPPVPLPLKMLVLVASPLDLKDEEHLQIEREQEILLEAVNTPAGQGKLQVDVEDEAKLEILESSLESGYQLFHFTGHGIPPDSGGGLLLEDESGKRRPTAIHEVLDALQKGQRQLRLTVLSGCQTARTLHVTGFNDLARGLLRGKIPAVIAMQFSISDEGGLRFAEGLYPKLVAGQPLEMAVSAARRALLLSDDSVLQADALAPVLLTANGRCLQTTAAASIAVEQPKIDFSFFLPLPQLSFGFYGRRREYRQIRDGLLQKNHRAVVIHGIGGIGKTALASHVATRLRKQFKGVYAFDCTTGTLAPERIVLELHRYFEPQGVQVLEQLLHQSLPPETLASYLAQVLSQWPLLLIFDNFESQLEHAGTSFQIQDENLRTFLGTLVKATATGTRFLFTSRYLFDVDTKRLGTIQELPLGDLSRPEALSLMQKLPHLSGAAFAEKLNAFETFGGHPYALVALDRHCSYRPLNQALRDAPALHTQLREFLVLELNYTRLSDRSRDLLNRLAAFRRPVRPEAAEWVMGEKVAIGQKFLQKLDRKTLSEEWQALDDAALLEELEPFLPEQRQAKDLDRPIAELIDWALLTPGHDDNQLTSLAVHSLVRDFCREKQPGEAWRTCLREAAAFYTNQTKLLSDDDKTSAVVWIEMEAFELLMEAQDFEEAASLLLNTSELLMRWGFGRYLESQYRRLLGRVEGRTAASIIHNLGRIHQNRGEYAAALAQYEQSLKINEALGDQAGVARSLGQIGIIHQERGNYTAALTHFKQAMKSLKAIGDQAGMAASLHNIGRIHQERGNYATALTRFKRAMKIKEDLGDQVGVAHSLQSIGNLYFLRGEYAAALAHYEQAIKIAEALSDQADVARSLGQIGTIHQERGEYAAALAHYEQALKSFETLGDQANVARLLHEIGNLYSLRGEYAAALAHYEQAIKIAEALSDQAGVAASLYQIGIIHQERGEHAAALADFKQALKNSQALGDQASVARLLHEIGNLHFLHGEYEAALEKYEQSLKIKKDLGNRVGVAHSLHQIGLLFTQTGRYTEAFEHLFFALDIFTKLESPHARTTVNAIKELRARWGEQEFDAAWREATGESVPDWLK